MAAATKLHPAGPKTIHFWAPTFKWGISIANIADFAKPPEKISYPQQLAVTCTGIIWSGYNMVITPINEFVKRARAAKIHAYIISHLKKEMPAMIGKAKTQQRLIDNLADEFGKVQREHHLPPGDFPNVEQFKEVLSGYNFDKFEKLKPKMIQSVDDMLGYGIPDLLKNFRNPYD